MKIQSSISFLLCLTAWSACNNSGEKTKAAQAWVAYSSKDGISLFGKKIELENLKTALYDSLSRMETLPAEIPIHYEGEVLMGMRGEIGTEVNDALRTAVTGKECEAVIHGFYAWYDAFSRDDSRRIDFTDDKGKHLKLDLVKLDAYLSHFKAGGFVGNEFIEGEKAFYKSCEKLWQNEPKGDVPSCLDYDRYFCAQDWELDFWTKSPVFINLAGDRVSATMKGTEGGGPKEQDFELVQENGKWVLSKIACDSE